MEISHDIKPHLILSVRETIDLINEHALRYYTVHIGKPRIYYCRGVWYCYVRGNHSSWGCTPTEAYKNWVLDNFGRS